MTKKPPIEVGQTWIDALKREHKVLYIGQHMVLARSIDDAESVHDITLWHDHFTLKEAEQLPPGWDREGERFTYLDREGGYLGVYPCNGVFNAGGPERGASAVIVANNDPSVNINDLRTILDLIEKEAEDVRVL